ncbi:unconventional myosin-XVB-like [Poecile atricapillus]|uniref:unconventional myosin-XVB-like n=1 Tax=Poecile atricapillus TaxID=48891 RepID=UPI00273932E4|nr:unconventional myosin-XVB-like [Poecile atricapillus]
MYSPGFCHNHSSCASSGRSCWFPRGSAAAAFAQVFLKEKARQLLERRWLQRQSWAVVTLQRKFRRLLHRRRLRVLQEKVTVIQAHFRGYQARKRYKRLKKTLMQFKTMILISRPLVRRRKRCQVTAVLSEQGVQEGLFLP